MPAKGTTAPWTVSPAAPLEAEPTAHQRFATGIAVLRVTNEASFVLPVLNAPQVPRSGRQGLGR